MNQRTNQLLIRTPEGIVFSQLLAGPVTRCLAWGIDFACLMAIMSVLSTFATLFKIVSVDFARALNVLLYFVVSIGYAIVLEWYWRGQTVGKRLLRLRVVDAQGLRLQFSQVAIRNLLRFVDMLPLLYLVGGVACLVNRRAQRLGDVAANTVVVRTPKLAEPDLDQVVAPKYNSLLEQPHLAARLRHQTNAAEAGIALQAVLRRDELEPAARLELFSELAAHLRSKVDFPAAASEGLTDEQFVRNTLDVLYRPSARGSQRQNVFIA